MDGLSRHPNRPRTVNQTAPISITQATIGYFDRAVLSNVSFSVPQGAFSALLGPNGAGKSSLLKTLAGIIPLLSGCLTLSSPNTTLGYVPQRETLDPIYRLNAYEIVLMGSYQRVKPWRRIPQSIKSEAHNCLAAAGVQDLADRTFSELSGGQKQRVLTARALLTSPDILLLDEPTAGLDPAGADALVQMLSTLHKDRNIAMLMVTHDLGLVRKYFLDATWVHQGKLHHGPVAEMLQPQNVAHFLGIGEMSPALTA